METEGWGARLLSYEDEDGQWAGGAFLPSGFEFSEWQEVGQPWTATTFSLSQLRDLGLDPTSDRAKRAVELIGANSRWDHAGEPYWEGEVEECVNGRLVADGAYFGVDVSSVVGRLVGERLADGGWNCERANGSVRSSFASTINVLEGLLEDGTWILGWTMPGRVWFDVDDGVGKPSRWVTLRAMRVLAWCDSSGGASRGATRVVHQARPGRAV